MLKAGILEIADVFVVNKADKDGADRTVKELREMISMNDSMPMSGHHGPNAVESSDEFTGETDSEEWIPPVIETVAISGEGVDQFLNTLEQHVSWLIDTGTLEANERNRYLDEIRSLLREDTATLLEEELEARGGLDVYVESVMTNETDPYTVAAEFLDPLESCLRKQRTKNRLSISQNK